MNYIKDDWKNKVYENIIENPNVIIKLSIDEHDDISVRILTTSLSKDKILVSICAAEKSFGKVFNRSNPDDIIEFVDQHCLNVVKTDNVQIDIIKSSQKIDKSITYRPNMHPYDQYMNKYNEIKSSEKLDLGSGLSLINNSLRLFYEYLSTKTCNTVIISFKTEADELNKPFTIDIIIDKFYIYSTALISIAIIRPELVDIFGTDFCNLVNVASNHNENDQSSYDDLIIGFSEILHVAYNRAKSVAGNNPISAVTYEKCFKY